MIWRWEFNIQSGAPHIIVIVIKYGNGNGKGTEGKMKLEMNGKGIEIGTDLPSTRLRMTHSRVTGSKNERLFDQVSLIIRIGCEFTL
jgi:hypothetical protein